MTSVSERSATVSATTSEELLRQEEQSPITEALLTLSIPESFSRVLEDGVRVEPLVVALTSSISDLSEAADISERHNIILQDIRSTDAIEIAASITQSEPLVKPAALVALIDGVSRAVTPAGTTEQAVSTSDIQALGESTTDGFLQSSSSTFGTSTSSATNEFILRAIVSSPSQLDPAEEFSDAFTLPTATQNITSPITTVGDVASAINTPIVTQQTTVPVFVDAFTQSQTEGILQQDITTFGLSIASAESIVNPSSMILSVSALQDAQESSTAITDPLLTLSSIVPSVTARPATIQSKALSTLAKTLDVGAAESRALSAAVTITQTNVETASDEKNVRRVIVDTSGILGIDINRSSNTMNVDTDGASTAEIQNP